MVSKMLTVKLSYSIISAWQSGNYEQAVAYYLGQDYPATAAMELGKLKDAFWNNHVLATNTIHNELGGGKLVSPKVQVKYEKIIPFSDDIQILFRGVPDMVDGSAVYDWKCGMTTASQYVDKWQLDAYKLLLPSLKIGYYLCYNPHNNTYTKGIKYLNTSNAETAMELLITHGGELIDYLRMQKLLKNYDRGGHAKSNA